MCALDKRKREVLEARVAVPSRVRASNVRLPGGFLCLASVPPFIGELSTHKCLVWW